MLIVPVRDPSVYPIYLDFNRTTPLAPSVLEELKRLTPRDSKGKHKQQLHRRLSRDVGHPKLRELLGSVVTLMKLSDDYDSFHALLERIHPKYGANMQLPLRDELKELAA